MKISGTETTVSADSASTPSPIESGSFSGLVSIVPDSYTRHSSGACSRRARFAARDGSPMPTKQTCPSRRVRAAATVIISSDV